MWMKSVLSRKEPRFGSRARSLQVEPLEERRLLSVYSVDNLADSGTGSLRWAIDQANSNTGPDAIEFSVAGTINVASALPALADSTGGTVIDGSTAPGYTAGGAPVVILDGASAAISGLTVTSAGNEVRALRIQAFAASGIYNTGTLTVTNSTISGNSASHGGGIYNDGVSSNGTLTVTNSTISGNSAELGGGIGNYYANATISNSTLSGNSAYSGGGIRNFSATVAVTNSTLSGNSAVYGGGIRHRHGTAAVVHSTLSQNSAEHGGGVHNHGTFEFGHTILAANTALIRGPDAYHYRGTLTSLGYNLVGDNTNFPFTPAPTDHVGTATAPIDPRLAPLADNGGPTMTHALLPDSPALDAGDPAFVPPPAHDQRGYPRIANGDGDQGTKIDIGAFERFTADRFEGNNTIATATVLGSLPQITLPLLSIHDTEDVDYFRVTAAETGKLIVNALFDHEVGNLEMNVRDRDGNVIASSTSTDDNERIVFPVVTQEPYFVEVFGLDGALNVYSLEIENFAAPAPSSVHLDPASDTGMDTDDKVTADDTPRIVVQADLADFEAMGIPIDSNGATGADVEVQFAGLNTGTTVVGNATRVGSTSLWTFAPATALLDDVYFVAAATTITDGQGTPVTGRTQLSELLQVVIDTTAPSAATIDLIASSDTGTFDDDNVTNKDQPAFTGLAEAGSMVRLYATDVFTGVTQLVGEGITGSDLSDVQQPVLIINGEEVDGAPDDNVGVWEVTVEPLDDGVYDIVVESEDRAGNVGPHYDFAAHGLPLEILDYRTVDVPVDVSNLSGAITDIDVKLNITHTYVYDLHVELVSPSGTTVTLFSHIDGGGDNFTGTTLDDEAPGSIDLAAPPYRGRFQPQPPALLSRFDGEDPNGQWILRVYDFLGGDVGTVDAVHLCIETGVRIEIDTIRPNTPLLDLDDASDTGRHDDDNVTNDNTPAVAITTHDPNANFHVVPDAIRGNSTDYLEVRVWDRFEAHSPNGPLLEEFLLYDSALDAGPDAVNTAGDMFTSLLLLNSDNADLANLAQQYDANIGNNAAVLAGGVLADGVHSLKIEVEDRAGNISHDFLLDITIDTVAPPVSILDIDPARTDTGVQGVPVTLADRVTSDTATGFVGEAEADAIVRMWADGDPISDAAIDDSDVFQGLTVAVPLDGNQAFPAGQWNLAGRNDLNDPGAGFPLDGLRQIGVTAEDVAGNVSEPDFLDVFIDTQGPQVTGVEITGHSAFNLFDVKGPDGQPQGPTPLVDSLTVSVRDLPNRAASFLYRALEDRGVDNDPAADPGNYLLIGDANGIIPISDVIVTNATPTPGSPATATIELQFAEPLPDDRFTLTVSDNVVDPAGNRLDGESNANEPNGGPQFPSGDGQPGGDFVARFTVDSRAEIGTSSAGSVYVDTNGNFLFDPQNTDFTNRDIVYTLGFTSDDVFAGNFQSPIAQAPADGFDKLAAYGEVGGVYRWMVDTTNDGVPDVVTSQGTGAAFNGLPVAGNFDGDASNGDEVALFTGTHWLFDTDRDFVAETSAASAETGLPIVGDFDGDGLEDLGLWRDDQFFLSLSTLGGGVPEALGGASTITTTFNFGFIGVRERPVAADMDGDGIDDLGLWVPDRSGAMPEAIGEWYFLISDDRSIDERLVPADPRDPNGPQTVEFTPVPFGEDLYAQWGDEFAIPVVGNFDPPVTGAEAELGPGLVHLTGTAGDDTLEVTPGPTAGSWGVTFNGAWQRIEADTLTVTFDGLGGSDTVIVVGGSGDDVARLWPGHGTVTGEGYSVAVSNVETVSVEGGGGADVAFLRDNPDGKDTLTGGPDGVTFSGDGYSNQVTSFRFVHVYGTAGQADAAQLRGAPGVEDTFEAWPDRAKLEGDGYLIRTNQISYVSVEGQSGDVDVALLHDNADTADTFEGRPDVATLSGDAFSVQANSFPYVHAYGTSGGSDVARFYDNPDGFDKLVARPDQTRLFGEGFLLRAKSFGRVRAWSTAGTGDLALLHDASTDDTFAAWPDRAELTGPGFDLRVNAFGYVHAYATGGADATTLYGSAGRDVFVGTDRFGKLRGSGYFNRAVSFEQVEVHGGGGRDVAVLRDAVLESGVTEPLDTTQLAWLYEFERIRQRSDSGESIVDATDQVFTAYWQ